MKKILNKYAVKLYICIEFIPNYWHYIWEESVTQKSVPHCLYPLFDKCLAWLKSTKFSELKRLRHKRPRKLTIYSVQCRVGLILCKELDEIFVNIHLEMAVLQRGTWEPCFSLISERWLHFGKANLTNYWMLNWKKKKRSYYITVYLNYQVFYYLFDHTIQSFCRYTNYKCKESELLRFSSGGGLLPQACCQNAGGNCRLDVLRPFACLRGVVDGAARNKGFLSWAPSQERLEGAGRAPARALCRLCPCLEHGAQRGAERPMCRCGGSRQPELSPERGNERGSRQHRAPVRGA